MIYSDAAKGVWYVYGMCVGMLDFCELRNDGVNHHPHPFGYAQDRL